MYMYRERERQITSYNRRAYYTRLCYFLVHCRSAAQGSPVRIAYHTASRRIVAIIK